MIQKHLIATILFSVILCANGFSYKDAKNWGKKYPKCMGKHQSPIVIQPPTMRKPQNIAQKLKFTNFEKLPTNMSMKNTGHTVEVKGDWSGNPPSVTGGPLHGKYVFEKATFHWTGKPFNRGNDHGGPYASTDNTLIDLEMHMFFYKKDLKSFKKAETQKGGLAIFQVWFEGRYNTMNVTTTFSEMQENLHKVRSPNSVAVLSPIMLAGFLSYPLPSFNFYEGSLDYPPCLESAIWFVYSDSPIGGIDPNLLDEFQKIKLDEGDKSNVRPNQALNRRHIKSIGSYNGKDE